MSPDIVEQDHPEFIDNVVPTRSYHIGQGIAFMRALASEAQANLEIRSQPGAGTLITCALPLKADLQLSGNPSK